MVQIIGAPKSDAAGVAGQGDVIKDGNIESFARDVIEQSMQLPVLVDFWAPWCGPCKQLTPVLERLVKQAGGRVKLVKINIDENQELASQMRVQSVPTVYAFFQGQPVTGFSGNQPESQIKTLIEKLSGRPLGPADSEELLNSANEALNLGDFKSARQFFEAILQEEPENVEAIGGLIRCYVSEGEFGEAKALLEQVPEQHASHPAINGAKAALTLAEESGELTPAARLEARLEDNADDHEARYELATSLFLRGQSEKAMQELVLIIKKDREWRDDGARKQLLKFFDALGATHSATLKGRRMLSSMLFS